MLNTNNDDRGWRTWAIATVVAAALPAAIEQTGRTVREWMRARHRQETQEES